MYKYAVFPKQSQALPQEVCQQAGFLTHPFRLWPYLHRRCIATSSLSLLKQHPTSVLVESRVQSTEYGAAVLMMPLQTHGPCMVR
jgi:hypothetical protein